MSSSSLVDAQVDPSWNGQPENESNERCENYEIHLHNQPTDLCYCNVCKCTLCSNCWDRQIPHRKQQLGPGGIPHERTDPWVAKQVEKVLSPISDELAFQQLCLKDEETAWFGKLNTIDEVTC
jgi:hypothetical protein